MLQGDGRVRLRETRQVYFEETRIGHFGKGGGARFKGIDRMVVRLTRNDKRTPRNSAHISSKHRHSPYISHLENDHA